MSLTKEECENSLINLCSSNSKVEDRKVFKQLIHEHFELIENFKQLEKNYDGLYDEIHNSKPLKFEELKDGKWYWCEAYGWCLMNFYQDLHGKIHYKANTVFDNEIDLLVEFEENRFYRNQVD